MTGTGTQNDPYIPASWSEFVTAIGTASAYVSVPEGTVWDMNEIQPTGITSAITVAAYRVEGNGAEIRNLFFTGGGCFTMPTNPSTNYHTFSDFIFSNVLIESGSSFAKTPTTSNWQYFTLSGCKVSCKIIDGCFAKWESGGQSQHILLSGTSLNAEISGNGTLAYRGSSSYGLILWLKNANIMLSGRMAGSANGTDIVAENTLIRGDWDTVSGLRFSTSEYTSKYSILDVDIPANSYLQSNGSLNKVLVNSDKIASGATVSSGFTQVTDAQLHNASYLSSIGFPIAT